MSGLLLLTHPLSQARDELLYVTRREENTKNQGGYIPPFVHAVRQARTAPRVIVESSCAGREPAA